MTETEHRHLEHTLNINWPWQNFNLRTRKVNGEARATLSWREEPSEDLVQHVLKEEELWGPGKVEALSFFHHANHEVLIDGMGI